MGWTQVLRQGMCMRLGILQRVLHIMEAVTAADAGIAAVLDW